MERLIGQLDGVELRATYAAETGALLVVLTSPRSWSGPTCPGAGEALMQVVPLSVGRTAQSWDEQHLDLAAAAGQLGAAPTSGFTDAVAGARPVRLDLAAARRRAGRPAESRADGLRSALDDYLRTDEAVARDQFALLTFLPEVR